jgi:site-specific recombinase XerD
MSDDLLTTLEREAAPITLTVTGAVAWFLEDARLRNLSPKTLRFYEQRLRPLVEAAGTRPITSLTTAQLKLILQHAAEAGGWSVTTYNHTVTALGVLCHVLVAEDLLPTTPMTGIPKRRGTVTLPEPLSDAEVSRMLAAVGDGFGGLRLRAQLLLFVDCGLRLSECAALQAADVDLNMGVVRVRVGKGRKERVVPFSLPVRRVLMKYLAVRAPRTHNTALWVTDGGEPLTPAGLVTALRRCASRAGVSGFHPHRLRHTFATAFLQAGGHAHHLQRLLGHTSPAMTARYVHLQDEDAFADHKIASPVLKLLGPRLK